MICINLMLAALSVARLGPSQKPLYDAVFAPQVVAVPPTSAVRDLCELPDGRLRHYGTENVAGEKRSVYIESGDLGLSWTKHLAASNDAGAMVQSPWSGDWLCLKTAKTGEKVRCVRSKAGPGDVNAETTEIDVLSCETRPLVALRSRRRWICPLTDVSGRGDTYRGLLALSDDDGRTWRKVLLPDDGTLPPPAAELEGDMPRWFNAACEPTVTELSDGTLLMAVRSSFGHHYLYRSADGGETWSKPKAMEEFFATNTMPLFLRLKDGRLLFFWNNTVPMPRYRKDIAHAITADEARGRWQTAFTNRDALHAAISEDDGKTWRGFREIILNPIRNRPDFREYLRRGAENDKSVHQTQAIELPEGKILLALGQSPASRRLVLFDVRWLYETDRTLDLQDGLEDVSLQLYVRSVNGGGRWGGHCAWERLPGAALEVEPDQQDAVFAREALHLCRIRDPRLVSDRAGVVWNFPAARAGRVETECRVDGAGFRLSLLDHWINPCDEFHARQAPVSIPVTAEMLGAKGAFVKLSVVWADDGAVRLFADGREVAALRAEMPKWGFSYLHLQTLAEGEDVAGSWFRSIVKKNALRPWLSGVF